MNPMTGLKDWRLVSTIRPTGISSRQIGVLGEALSKGLGYEPGSDIKGLVGKIRGALMIAPVEADADYLEGSLLVKKASPDFKIIVSASSGSRRDQISIAKALGHYFLHHRYFQFEKQARLSTSKVLAERGVL